MSASPSSPVAERYRLISPLGAGGMGRVWLAYDEVLRREVAVKEVVPPAGLTSVEQDMSNARSLREARAIARLNHPNVVRIFDVVSKQPHPWIVMEYVASRSLHQVLEQDGPLNPPEVARIGLALLAALGAAHRAGIVHRDVKPSNVLLSETRVVLTDWGLATMEDDATVTRSGMIIGSPAYISPERAREGTSGPSSDLWSLGATLYAAVEGRAPYERQSAIATLTALATEEPDPATRPGALRPVLDGLLRKDPAVRMGALAAERLLRRAVGRPKPQAPLPAWRPPRPRVEQRPSTPPPARPAKPAKPALPVMPTTAFGSTGTESERTIVTPPTPRSMPAQPTSPEPTSVVSVTSDATRIEPPAPVSTEPPTAAPSAPDAATIEPAASHATGSASTATEPSGVAPTVLDATLVEPAALAAALPPPADISTNASDSAVVEPPESASLESASLESASPGSASLESALPDLALPESVSSESALPDSSSSEVRSAEAASAEAAVAGTDVTESGSVVAEASQAEVASGADLAVPGAEAAEFSSVAGALPLTADTRTDAATADATDVGLTRADAANIDSPQPDITSVDASSLGATSLGATSVDATDAEATRVTKVGATRVDTPRVESTRADTPVVESARVDSTWGSAAKVAAAKVAAAKVAAAKVEAARVGAAKVGRGIARGVAAPMTGLRLDHPRNRFWAIVGAVLLVLLLVVVLVFAITHGSAHPASHAATPPLSSVHPSAAASASVKAAAPPSATPAGQAPGGQSGSGAASPQVGPGSPLPPGWSYRTDGTGFTLPVPDGWSSYRKNGMVYYKDPAGGRLLGIDQTNQPQPNPVADWEGQERARIPGGDFPGYQKVAIYPVDYHIKAADWEFTYNDHGVRTHVINRGAIFGPHQAYGFYWSTPDDQWAANLGNFALITSRFQGKTG